MPGLGKGCEPRSGVLGAPTCLGCRRSFGSLLTVSPLCKEGEDTAYILVLGEGPGYCPHAMAWDQWHPFGTALADLESQTSPRRRGQEVHGVVWHRLGDAGVCVGRSVSLLQHQVSATKGPQGSPDGFPGVCL